MTQLSDKEHDEIEKGMRYLSDFLGSQLEKLNVIAINPKEDLDKAYADLAKAIADWDKAFADWSKANTDRDKA
jgi:hypothetical protein